MPFQRYATRALILSAICAFGATSLLPGCTSDKGAASKSAENGSSLFAFDYEKVTQLLIVKNDPESGDRWTARLERPDLSSIQWVISSDSPSGPLLDRQADSYFVLHLLDTLRTLQVTESQAPGPDESLGLAPPRFALQWKTRDPRTGATQDFELRLGAPGRNKGTAYASVPGRPAFALNGATLQMLDYLKTFETLRQKSWTGLTSDDIDEIELKREGKSLFYAQREGADWTNRAHRSVRGDVQAWLDALTHGRVLRFVDDETAARTLRTRILKSPLREAILKDRQGHATRLQIGWASGSPRRLIGLSSARPEGVFVLFPAALGSLEPPRQ